MADLGLLKALREAGVKSAQLDVHGNVHQVEFFPRGLLDIHGLDEAVEPMDPPTDRPPPAAPEDGQPNLPPAMQRVLSRKSVS